MMYSYELRNSLDGGSNAHMDISREDNDYNCVKKDAVYHAVYQILRVALNLIL